MKSQEKVTAFRNGEIKRNRGKGNMGMDACTLCPRMCGVNRAAGEKGYCGMDATIRAARAALHMWEEPCISGKKPFMEKRDAEQVGQLVMKRMKSRENYTVTLDDLESLGIKIK